MSIVRVLSAGETASVPPALVITKLRAPQMSAALVKRERLIARLSRALQMNQRLSVIVAPAGYGKTTLGAQWLHEQQDIACAWLSLDAGDDEYDRFVNGLVATLVTAGVELRGSINLTALLNAIVTFQRKLVIVLDDYHVITTPSIHAMLQALIERLPDHVHLVLISRHQSALALGRLRAMNRLAELDTTDLCFTHDETAALMNDVMQVGLKDEEVSRLHAKTEGWVAGLCLAALAIKQQLRDSRVGVAGVIQHLGRQRYLQDYLREEVFDRQDNDLKRFLLQTSLLDQLNAHLCNVITGRSDSHEVLSRLVQTNLFVQHACDGHADEGITYHPLFAEFLRDQLRRSQSECFCELEQRAAACQCEQRRNGAQQARGQKAGVLSERELEVARLLADGLSNHEIARRICVAPGTVKRHIHNIFSKLDARNRVEVVVHVRRMNASA